jgi:hypothetical protein
MWDDRAMAALELPLAEPGASPKYPTADYYYRIPVRTIYRSYPIYAPGHEPPGYLDRLKQQEPVIIWDDADHAPPLNTEADWVKAGEIVFDSPVALNAPAFGGVQEVRDPVRYENLGVPIGKDGIMPFARYVIRKKGQVEVGQGSCAMCHTRVMPDGSILKGAQGNSSNQHVAADRLRRSAANSKDQPRVLGQVPSIYRSLWGTPWLRPDPLSQIARMTIDEFASVMDAIPPSVDPRGGSSVFHPIQLPDLIGVKDRLYLDHTGLQQHRSIADMMRYAALNQGADSLASYGGLYPRTEPRSNNCRTPDKVSNGRYSDQQLYALALYLYSLQPPANPNGFDDVAARGQKVFEREGCARVPHAAALYKQQANASGRFRRRRRPQEEVRHPAVLSRNRSQLDSQDPSRDRLLQGAVAERRLVSGMFPHDGSCATLEDWFDPRRLRGDYVPTGFKGYGIQTRAVKGHEFGLKISVNNKRALIAFLRTL